MSDAQSGEDEAVVLSESQQQWLAAEATHHDLEPTELLEALIAAYQRATAEGVEYVAADELAATQAEFQELLEDVRNRVVQVKQEADSKAPADHEHEELTERLTAAQATVDELEAELAAVTDQATALETELEALDETVTQGFDNYEEILESVLDRTDAIEDRLDTLARAVLDARSQLRDVSGERREQELLAQLKAAANQAGIDQATCDNCGQRVNVGLLTKPRCPHCSTTVVELGVTKRLGGLLTKYRLHSGDHPALTGSTQPKLDEAIAEELGTDSDTTREEAAE